MPRYYYENKDGELSYYSLEFHDGYSRWEHTVMYCSKTDEAKDDFYWLWDDTGEEETFDD